MAGQEGLQNDNSDISAPEDVVDVAPSMPEMFHHTKQGGLRLSDALTLSGMANDRMSETRVGLLDNILQHAEDTLAHPENGPAGAAAFGRFVDWLMPAVRNNADLDPNSENYLLRGNRMQAFAPTVERQVDMLFAGGYGAGPMIGDQIYRSQPGAPGPAQTDAGGMNKLPEDQRMPPSEWGFGDIPERPSLADIFSRKA